MNQKPTDESKTSIADVRREATAAIADVAVKATHATEKIADATQKVVDSATDKVAAGGRAAARTIKGAAAKLDAATTRFGKKA